MNTPILERSGQGKISPNFTIEDLTFDYSGQSGYLFAPSIGSVPYNPADPILTSFTLRNVSFTGKHFGNAGVSGTYMDISGAKNTIFDGIRVSLSGQDSYDPARGTGGGFFIFHEGGAGIQILNSDFNELGYSTAIILLYIADANVQGNRFTGGGLIKQEDDNPRGERFVNAGGLFANNHLSNGSFFDYLLQINSDTGTVWTDYKRNFATPDGTFGLRTVVTGNTFDILPSGFGLLIRADVSPQTVEKMLTISGNSFNNGLAIRSDLASPYDLTFGANFINGIHFDHLRVGGTSADHLNLVRAAGNNWISGGLGNDFLYSTPNKFDAFVFHSPLNAQTNLDRIFGFETSGTEADQIWLHSETFPGIVGSIDQLNPNSFIANISGSASGNSSQIIYNTTTGELLYDADGAGAQKSVAFTILSGRESITSQSFRLFNVTSPPPISPSLISLSASPSSVVEDGPTNLTYTFTRTGSISSALTINYSVGGTATLGSDYTGLPGTPASITFAAGSATATVTIDPTTDSAVEPDETVALSLAAGIGYTIGTADAIMGTITSDDVVLTASALPKPKVIGAVDLDSASSSPATQSAGNAFDNKPSTKYLNFGGINSGVNFTYSLPTRLSSFAITTANDRPARDPASYQLYGFQGGSWRLLTSGKLNLPSGRLKESALVSLPNLPSLSQYRLIFPKLKENGNVMQIADLKLYGTQSSALPKPATATPIDLDSSGSSPPTQSAANAFDNKTSTKYLNSGGINSGVNFTYNLPTRISSFIITTANDVPGRDPAAYQLYGFSQGSWKLLASGSLQLPSARLTDSTPISLPNLPSLTQYRLIFPRLKANGNVMQIAELKLFGSQSSPSAPPPAALPVITLAISPASVPEDGPNNLIYTFSRSGPTTNPLTVNYTTGGTATPGSDFTGIAGTPASITFAAGSATATLTVDPSTDSAVEPDETVALSLAAGSGYTIGTTTAVVGTIANDDVPPPPVVTLAVSPASVPEDGPANLIYTFSRSGPTTHPLTVNYSTGGTATLGSDYTGLPGTPASITFAAGSATATVTIDPSTDSAVEPDETVALSLAAGSGYTIGTTTAVVGTIAN
ncbi:MAG: Calx-beta domain-containing protein, partial [Cyanobacteriota bacterium]|nr:Calx-beta domain-containing protein [Cyanobacteriota bacterium]